MSLTATSKQRCCVGWAANIDKEIPSAESDPKQRIVSTALAGNSFEQHHSRNSAKYEVYPLFTSHAVEFARK
jgi:hypothetical protein